MRKMMTTEIKSPTRKAPSAKSERLFVLPRTIPMNGFTMSSMSACTSFCAAPPKMKPMANPATPRSRMNAAKSEIRSRTYFILLLCLIYRLVDKRICLHVLLAWNVYEPVRRKVCEECPDLGDLRLAARPFFFSVSRYLLRSKHSVHAHLDDASGKPQPLCFSERERHRFVLRPVICLRA